ncbi:MAG: pilus assembly protein [Gemmobacter sp.]
MKLFNLFKTFRSDESGAVTVDWVVLTAAIVGLGIVVMQTVGGGIGSLASSISTSVSETQVGYPGSTGGTGGSGGGG